MLALCQMYVDINFTKKFHIFLTSPQIFLEITEFLLPIPQWAFVFFIYLFIAQQWFWKSQVGAIFPSFFIIVE